MTTTIRPPALRQFIFDHFAAAQLDAARYFLYLYTLDAEALIEEVIERCLQEGQAATSGDTNDLVVLTTRDLSESVYPEIDVLVDVSDDPVVVVKWIVLFATTLGLPK